MTELRKDATVLALIWLTLWQYQLICSPIWNGNLRKRHCEVCNRNTISIVYSFDLTLETWKDVCYRNTVSSSKTVFTFCIHRAHYTQHVPKDKTLGKPDYKGAILWSILHRHCYWHGFRVFILLSSITAEKLVSCECQISFCCALYSTVSVNVNGILLITLTHVILASMCLSWNWLPTLRYETGGYRVTLRSVQSECSFHHALIWFELGN